MVLIQKARRRRAFEGWEPCEYEVERFCYLVGVFVPYHVCNCRTSGHVECPYPARYCRVWHDRDAYGEALP